MRDRPARGSLPQDRVTAIYERNAPFYDAMELIFERARIADLRPKLLAGLGGEVLELGVGTGKSLPHYPRSPGLRLTAVDTAEGMLRVARRKTMRLPFPVDLRRADAQALPFDDASFDAVVASFVFCSVADPSRGLREVRRVLKPGGKLRLLEHQRPSLAWLAPLFDLVNPLVVRVMGANINRPTQDTVAFAGLDEVDAEHLDRAGILRLIHARRT